MTNPNNAVGTNAAYDGRTSVKAFNDGVGAYSRGIISGWACVPDTGMTVSLGGDGNTRDVAIAQDSGGNKTTINNISESPINVTLSAAPASNSRIDAIVAYVDNPPQGSATVIDNPAACGLIAVKGTVASTPVAPNESAIRAAITADGASGATAYYVVLANITIANGTTDLTSGDIQAGDSAGIGSNNIGFTTTTVAATVTREGGQSFTNDVTRIHLGGHLYCYLYEHEPGFVNTSNNIHVGVNIPANKATILGGSITPCISNEIHFDLIGHQSMSADNSSIYMDIWLCRANTSSNTVKVSAVIFTSEP